MSAASSTETRLIMKNSVLYSNPKSYVRMNSPDIGSSSPYQPSSRIQYTYRKPSQAKYRYTVAQDGESYRCCQWCRQWCTRRCPLFDFCDRIVACPLLFYILSGLFLFLLLVGLITLFGLHPSINPSRRFYGIISTLSLVNRTTYIYGLDRLCNRLGVINHCLDLTTSTAVSYLATTVTLNQSSFIPTFSLTLLSVSLLLSYFRIRGLIF